jgi:glycosyltransferase involved in cell wall biosynthesis
MFMIGRKMPVVAAIPAYNAELTLRPLLADVLDQEYDSVYVLDDASTDNTYELAHSYYPDVKVIRGQENIGAGANRNRIIPELGYSAIIHFLDSDIRLNSENSAEKARELGSIANIGFVGGMVRNPDGTQNPYNFGPRMSLKSSFLVSGVQYGIYALGRHKSELAKKMRNDLDWLLKDWPNTFKEPAARPIYWNAEANLVIPSKVFKQLGGNNPKLRYHEIMEFSIRTHKAGLKSRFDPSLDVTHYDFDNLSKKFNLEPIKAAARIIIGMGIKDWVFPPKEEL